MILIALGANLPSSVGPPSVTLKAALEMLGRKGAVLAATSQFYVSEAWPDRNDPSYVNAVARIETQLGPSPLLVLLEAVENAFGRIRTARNTPRPLDLDLLDYNGLIQDGPPVLPHPRMQSRGFVLLPLADVAPEWGHPVSRRTVRELIAELPSAERTLPRLV